MGSLFTRQIYGYKPNPGTNGLRLSFNKRQILPCMKKRNTQLFEFILASVLVFMTGCSLDEPSSTSKAPALTLTASRNLSLTTLNWAPVRVTGFKEYILLQSSMDIPDKPTPMVTQEVSVVKRIDDADISSTTLSATIFSPQVCYKLYCDIGDRFLYSSTVCVDQEFDIVPGFYDKACHLPGEEEMVLFDRLNNNITILNYKTGLITLTVPSSLLNFPSMEMSSWENTINIFGFDQSPGMLRKFNYPSLASTHFKEFSQVLWAVNVHNQYVFAATDEFGKNFQVLNRNNLTVLDSRSGMTGNQNVAVFPGDPLTVIAMGDLGSKKYTINNAGKVTHEESFSVTLGQPEFQSNCAEGTELFIGGRFGTIINRNGERVGLLNDTQNSFILINRLSSDETKAIYVISDSNSGVRIEIADISNLPSISRIKSYEVPSLNFADLIIDHDIIYLIGAIFNNSQPETFILKYPFTL